MRALHRSGLLLLALVVLGGSGCDDDIAPSLPDLTSGGNNDMSVGDIAPSDGAVVDQTSGGEMSVTPDMTMPTLDIGVLPDMVKLPDILVSSCQTNCNPSCSETCNGMAECMQTCPAGCPACSFDCSSSTTCITVCESGSTCSMTSKSSTSVSLTCNNNGTCSLDCSTVNDCKLTCAPNASCLLKCTTVASCMMLGCNKPMTCPGGVTVCNRNCP